MTNTQLSDGEIQKIVENFSNFSTKDITINKDNLI